MKAKPLKMRNGGYEPCDADRATHLQFNVPGPFPTRVIPVIRKGQREGTGCWSWNGDTEKPTIKPSVRTTDGQGTVCHSFINDGQIQFLSDSTHEFAGQTLNLLEVEA